VRYHFWQKGGGYDRNIYEPRAMLGSMDYLHLNPVRKDLVVRAEDWFWSRRSRWPRPRVHVESGLP
jgi:putative transposase